MIVTFFGLDFFSTCAKTKDGFIFSEKAPPTLSRNKKQLDAGLPLECCLNYAKKNLIKDNALTNL